MSSLIILLYIFDLNVNNWLQVDCRVMYNTILMIMLIMLTMKQQSFLMNTRTKFNEHY